MDSIDLVFMCCEALLSGVSKSERCSKLRRDEKTVLDVTYTDVSWQDRRLVRRSTLCRQRKSSLSRPYGTVWDRMVPYGTVYRHTGRHNAPILGQF